MLKQATLLSFLLLASMQTSVQAGTVIIQEQYGTYFQARHDRLNGKLVDRFYSVPYGAGTYLRSEFTSTYRIQPLRAGSSTTGTGYEGITADTVAYNPTTQSVYAWDYDTKTTSRDGVRYSQSTITHSGTVVEENGFNLESSIAPQWNYGDKNPSFGTTRVFISQTVDHYVDATGSWIQKVADTFGDVSSVDAKALGNKATNPDRSQHTQKKDKTLVIPKRLTGLGVRGSVSMGGTSVHTASPGILAYDITFGDTDSIALPFAFGANKDGATLEVFFEGSSLGSVRGDDYTLDELAFMDIDMTNLKGQTGLLEFIINTTGTNSANVFIPESLATTAVPVPAAIWLFGSGLLGMIGVARRKKTA